MKYIIRIYAVVSFITFAVLLVGGVLAFFLRAETQSDVSVLLNARRETGYDATLFILGEEYTGQLMICGGVQIAPGVGVTAAHCVDDARRIFVGKEYIDIEAENYSEVENILIKDGWVGLDDGWEITKIVNDLAVFSFDPTKTDNLEYESIATVDLGCNYRIVAFGTRLGEKEIDIENRYKEGLDVCIKSFSEDLIFLKPSTDQGFCFGDSGSPIYDTRTGEAVAVLSSTVGTTSEGLCDIDNRALGVRLDSNKPFISSASASVNFNFNDEDVIAKDSETSVFDVEIIDLINDYDWDSQTFNIFNEDEIAQGSFDREPLENIPEQTENRIESNSLASSFFDFGIFADVSDTAFFGYFVVIGINLFLSTILLAWTFKRPRRIQYTNPAPNAFQAV